MRSFLDSGLAGRWVAEGRLVDGRPVGAESRPAGLPAAGLVLEHTPVAFPSYPHEWAPEMLDAAASLTLDLAEQALPAGLGLKDATPHNVLFEGPRPLFVDWLSFARRDPDDPFWMPEAQFVRTFLLPLLCNRRFQLPLASVFTASREGLEPEAVYRMCGLGLRLRPPFLTLATLPTWLSRRAERLGPGLYERRPSVSPAQAAYVLGRTFKRLRRALARCAPRGARASAWSSYMEGGAAHYGPEAFAAKEAFVRRGLLRLRPARVLDVGCNTGHFSLCCAAAGAAVVAIDKDATVVGELWRRARAEDAPVLPLVVDLAWPSPALGWGNGECSSFLQRAKGSFDLVLLLASLHHLLAGAGVDLSSALETVAALGRHAIVEFVDPSDPLFRRVARGREALHAGLTRDSFERACARHFVVHETESLPGRSRSLYLLERR